MNKIVRREMIVPNLHLLEVSAPLVASKLKPGQFVIIRPDETGERVPLTVADWNPQEGTVTCFFLQVGTSTAKLAKLVAGDEVPTFVGPLGKPLEAQDWGQVVVAGGCYGIGSIYPLAKAFKRAGNRVTVMIEARSNFLLYWERRLSQWSDELIISTADGSRGRRGHSASQLAELLQKGKKVDIVFAMGCTFMLSAVSEATRPFDVKTIVSLNPVMVDGTGMCGACRVEVAGKTLFACVDGPNFDGHQVDWELLRARRRAYYLQETLSAER